jgi:hypothetical protein
MSDEEKTEEASPETEEKEVPESKSGSNASAKPQRILLVPYPKFVFMYPTLIISALAAIVVYFASDSGVDPATQTVPVVMTGLFLAIMMANMFIIVFDFPRATSLTLLFVITTVALVVWMVFLKGSPDAVPAAPVAVAVAEAEAESGGFLSNIRPAANATFFFCITLGMSVMYVAVLISVNFNYWELRNNELLHHHGMLSDLKRYPAPNLRIDKEINDVFEFMLLGAGRLILHPSTEKRAIVLDNVLFVGSKEQQLTKMLGSIKVQIGGDAGIG